MVSIHLVRQSTGTSVTKTEVTVYQGGNYKATTNDQGVAHFPDVSPGRRRVYAEGRDLGDHDIEGLYVVYI